MALLLAMYQQAKLTREIGSLTLQQTQIDRKIDRIQTNIKNTQKRYQSLFTQLETRAKNMTNQANSMYSQMSMGGLGGLGGALGGMFGGGIGSFLGGIAGDLVSSLFNKNLATSGITNEKLLKAIEDGTVKMTGVEGEYTQEEVQKANAAYANAQQMANYAIQMQQQWASQMKANAQANISAWLEIQKEELTAQQEQEEDALNYENTMLELDRTHINNRLTMLETRKEEYSKLASKSAQESAPKFGLS